MLLTGVTITFLREFGVGLRLTCPLWLSLALGITVLGQVVGKKGRWIAFDSFYCSSVTATTVGYGDLRVNRTSRVVAILIVLIGLTFSGIIIAAAVHATTFALAAHEPAAKVG
jgi:voltage-gated potassium channel